MAPSQIRPNLRLIYICHKIVIVRADCTFHGNLHICIRRDDR
jgi:hypothetical protein